MKIVVFENETSHYRNCFLRMFKKSQNYCDGKIRTDSRTDWTEFSEGQKLSQSSLLWKLWQNLILNVPSSKFLRLRFCNMLNFLWLMNEILQFNFLDSKMWSIRFLCFRVQLIWQFLRRMNFFLTCSYSRFQILSHLFPKHHNVSCHQPLNYPTFIGWIENPSEFQLFYSKNSKKRLSSP